MGNLDNILEYEKVLNALFAELKMSAAMSRFVRALILASNGETNFEISQKELAKSYLGADTRSEVQNVRDNLTALKKWQKKHQINLVTIVEGSRVKDREGKFTFVKTKYEFGLLENLVKLLFSESDELETQVSTAIEELKKSFQLKRNKKSYHPRRLVRQARRTIQTKLKNIFNLAQSIEGVCPVEYCKSVLNESVENLEILEEDYLHKLNRRKRIESFEKRLSCADSES